MYFGLRRLMRILLQQNVVRMTCPCGCMRYRIVNSLVVSDNGKLLQEQKILTKHTRCITLLPRNINIMFTLPLVRDHLSFKRGGRIKEVQFGFSFVFRSQYQTKRCPTSYPQKTDKYVISGLQWGQCCLLGSLLLQFWSDVAYSLEKLHGIGP